MELPPPSLRSLNTLSPLGFLSTAKSSSWITLQFTRAQKPEWLKTYYGNLYSTESHCMCWWSTFLLEPQN